MRSVIPDHEDSGLKTGCTDGDQAGCNSEEFGRRVTYASAKKSLFLCLTAVLVLCRCSDDSSPFTPETLAETELAYFPLREGYKADYVFFYDYNYGYYNALYDIEHKYDGVFSLEVVDIHFKESRNEVFYKLKTTLFIKEEHYSKTPNWEGDFVEYTVKDSSITAEYDIMLNNGSLWYVENAPDFDRLDEGDTTLMMAAPVASGGAMDLRLFNCLELIDIPVILDVTPDSYSAYKYNLANYMQDASYRSIDVITNKSKGIKAISFFQQLGGGASFFRYRADFKFELIE